MKKMYIVVSLCNPFNMLCDYLQTLQMKDEGLHCKGPWSNPERKIPKDKTVLALKKCKQFCGQVIPVATVNNSCVVHKQGRGYEIRFSLCPPLNTSLIVKLQTVLKARQIPVCLNVIAGNLPDRK